MTTSTDRSTTAKVVIHPSTDMAGFLDMLRYDGCTVVDWTRTERKGRHGDTFEVTLRGNPLKTYLYQFTPARWASFGLYLKDEAGNRIEE